jgi:hypothetical protein
VAPEKVAHETKKTTFFGREVVFKKRCLDCHRGTEKEEREICKHCGATGRWELIDDVTHEGQKEPKTEKKAAAVQKSISVSESSEGSSGEETESTTQEEEKEQASKARKPSRPERTGARESWQEARKETTMLPLFEGWRHGGGELRCR